jgi:hypothetical protein
MLGRECYQFGEFLLEVAERRLFHAGQPIQLAPKTHDVLVALLRRAGGLVKKRELLAQVWPEAFVEEGILAVHISALRRALNGKGGSLPHLPMRQRRSDFSMDVWEWPEGFRHYVAEHEVRPSPEFELFVREWAQEKHG